MIQYDIGIDVNVHIFFLFANAVSLFSVCPVISWSLIYVALALFEIIYNIVFVQLNEQIV